MLMRKRAWDLMREEYPSITTKQQLADAMSALHEFQKAQPQCIAVAVVDDEGRPKGMITMRGVLDYIRGSLKSRDVLREIENGGFDQLITQSCQMFGSTPITGIMEETVLKVSPEDSLLSLVDKFLKNRKEAALVVDGDKVLGMILLADVYREVSKSVAEDCRLY